MSDDKFRAGFVAVVGRPNVGKSTLINAIMGSKVSIVSRRPQTTRHRILAVQTTKSHQIIFVDTPGLHRNAGKVMNRMMNKTAANALVDADLVVLMCEANRWTSEDQDALNRLKDIQSPAIAVLNKIDKVHPREEVLVAMSELAERYGFADVVPMSATRNENIDTFLALIPKYLPESELLFPEDTITDRSESFRAAELIREKLNGQLRQEVPYGLTVQIEQFDRDEHGAAIHAIIWVERDSQKGIVVGKGGSVLKKVGRAARLEMKESMGMPVHLEMWVKVKDNWADNEKDLLSLGYDIP